MGAHSWSRSQLEPASCLAGPDRSVRSWTVELGLQRLGAQPKLGRACDGSLGGRACLDRWRHSTRSVGVARIRTACQRHLDQEREGCRSGHQRSRCRRARVRVGDADPALDAVVLRSQARPVQPGERSGSGFASYVHGHGLLALPPTRRVPQDLRRGNAGHQGGDDDCQLDVSTHAPQATIRAVESLSKHGHSPCILLEGQERSRSRLLGTTRVRGGHNAFVCGVSQILSDHSDQHRRPQEQGATSLVVQTSNSVVARS